MSIAILAYKRVYIHMLQTMDSHSSTESETYGGVCKKLDVLVADFFSTMAELYLEQDRLEVSMKSGFLNLSRAR